MLSDITVLELGDRVSTAYCGRLLTDLGATVVLLEPAAGTPLRAAEPAYAAFLHAGKRSVTALDGLRGLDAVICDDDVPELASRLAALRARFPGLAVVTVSDYGTDGPRAGTPATEFTLQSEAGISALHPTGDRPPVPAGVDLAELTSAACAAVGVVTALLSSEATADGIGIDVDVSRFEAAVSILQYPWLSAQIEGHNPYPLPQNAIPGVELARDGWITVVSVTDPQWADFKKMAGIAELDNPRYDTLNHRVQRADEVTPLVREFTMRHTVDELVDLGARHRVPTVPVGTPETIAQLVPYASRSTYVDNVAGGFHQPRSPFRYDEDPETKWVAGALPAVGADNGDGLGGNRRRPSVRSGDDRFPLRGLRVLELGTFQAGPLVTRNLAALGADVIKVEAVARPDLIRFAGSPMTVPRSWERGAPFIGTNQGKRAITADLTQPAGLEIVQKLIARSDLVLDNYIPRVLDQRGLDYAGVAAIRPDVIMIRLPAWGLTGAWRDRPGFTYSVDGTSGLTDLTGYPDGDPMMTGTVVDPIAAQFSTFVTLAAIRRRQLTGRGGLVEVPLCDIAAQLTARAVVTASATGLVPVRSGCRHESRAPQGMYRCGDEKWIAISVAENRQWAAFAEIPDVAAWANDPRFADAAGRLAHHAELDERLIALCATGESTELVAHLVKLGVPAAPLGVGDRAVDDPQLLSRGRVFPLEHPVFGTVRYLGSPMRFSNSPQAGYAWASPVFGQHNHEVLTELGYSNEEIAALAEAGQIGDSPFGLPIPR